MFEYFSELLSGYTDLLIIAHLLSIWCFYWCLSSAAVVEDTPEYEEYMAEYEEEIDEAGAQTLSNIFGTIALLSGLFPIINIIVMLVVFTEEAKILAINIFNWPLNLLKKYA